ncbi:MAG: NAD(P)/FAD-dependent oxidoreductase [Acidobacteriota bacterium]
MPQPTSRFEVVVIGGGFGGLNAARALAGLPVSVTLIDKRNFHLFQPLLYQVATGGLSPGDIAAPLRSVLSTQENVTVLLDEVVDIDPAARRVSLKNCTAIHYDALIIATGAESTYFGHDEWAQFAPSLKTIEDATEIRARILAAFENAEREDDTEKRKSWMRFVVVGGGPTGVELAGAIGEIARDTLRHDFRRIHPEQAEILLLDAGPRILAAMKPDLSEKAEHSLIHLGVRTRTNVRVTSIDADGVSMSTSHGDERIAARTVLWAAGVQATNLNRQLAQALGIQTDRSGRISVDSGLSIPAHPEIFVIGDAAACSQDGSLLPGTCPVAMQQGRYLSKAIAARLAQQPSPAFHYTDKGTMATIGRKSAVADLGFIRFGGVLAWLAWLFLHLLYLVGFRSRLSVALQWAFQYSTFNRGARIITSQSSLRE